MVKVCAGVVTFNRSSLLSECVRGLLSQTKPVEQIFIIDNASSDESPKIIESLQSLHPGRITAIRHAENTGSAGGFCAAAKAGFNYGADWVWLLDDDVALMDNTLEALLESSAAKDVMTGALGSFVRDERGGRFLNNIQCLVDRKNFNFIPVPAVPGDAAISVDTNSFDSVLVQRRALMSCGFPNEDYFLWFDDIEFFLRISRQFKIWLIPQSQVTHGSEAQSTEKKIPFFRNPTEVYEWPHIWKMYYRLRNYYDVARRNSAVWPFHKLFFKSFLKQLILIFLLRQDHKWQRLRLLFRAGVDGYCGWLGKSVSLTPPFSFRRSTGLVKNREGATDAH